MRPDTLMPGLAMTPLAMPPLATLVLLGLVFSCLILAGCAANPSPAGQAEAPAGAVPSPAHHASDLVGDSAADLTALFGPPSLRHQDGPAEVWLYAARGCRLDVVLYRPAADRGGERVSLAEVRSAHPSSPSSDAHSFSDEGACLRALTAAIRE